MVSDIPSDNKSTTQTSSTSKLSLESRANSVTAADKLSNVTATVQSSTMQAQSATANAAQANAAAIKAQYEATLVFNRQPTPAPTLGSATQASQPAPSTPPLPAPATQLTPDVIQRINQGLLTQVKVLSPFPLMRGDQVRLNSTAPAGAPGGPLQLSVHQVNTGQNPLRTQQVITNLVRALVPTQNSYSPLLSNLLALATHSPNAKGVLNSLPLPVQQAIKHITQQLPTTDTLKQAGAVKQAFQNSGIFLESQVKAKSASPGPGSAPRPASSPIATPITQDKPPAPSSTNADQRSPITDFKHQLLHLEKTLVQFSRATAPQRPLASAPQSTTYSPHGSPPSAQTSAPMASSDGKVKQAAIQSTVNPAPSTEQATGKGQQQAAQTKGSENQSPTTTTRNASTNLPQEGPRSSPVRAQVNSPTSAPLNTATASSGPIGAYQSAAHTPPSNITGLPPLPGQIILQAQPTEGPSIKGNEVADALVRILLKQTQESINRLQLHQLSTAAQHGDDNIQVTQPPLSFDLPILHFGQLTLFHFHIEEEQRQQDDNQDPQQDKKWHVSLGFDIEGLGAMFCELSLVHTQVYVRFWAKESDTVSKAKHHFSSLTENLQEIGVTVKELECIEGMPPQQDSHLHSTLIDIET